MGASAIQYRLSPVALPQISKMMLPQISHARNQSTSGNGRTTVLGHWMWVIAFFCVPMQRFIESTLSSVVPDLLLALLVGSLMFGRIARVNNTGGWLIMVPLCLIAGFVSGTNSDMLQSVFSGLKLALLLGIGPFALAYYLRHSKNFLQHVICSFICSQTLSAAVGLFQLTGSGVVGQYARGGRINGLSMHPNVLGIMSALVLLIVIQLLLKGKRKNLGPLLFVGIVNALALLFTGSLSSMSSLAVGVFVLLVASRAVFRTFIVLGLILGVFFAGQLAFQASADVSTGIIEARIGSVTGTAPDASGSLNVRQRTYEYAWDYISNKDWVVGVGMDNTNARTFNNATAVHSFPLRAWYQGGVALLIVVIILCIKTGSVLGKAFRRKTLPLAAAVIATMGLYAATSAFYINYQYWLPILMAFAVLSISSNNTPTRLNRWNSAPIRRM